MSDVYEKLRKAPAWALRPIQAGRLKGKTDINPQWRYEELDRLLAYWNEKTGGEFMMSELPESWLERKGYVIR